jgi:hypothetical protein
MGRPVAESIGSSGERICIDKTLDFFSPDERRHVFASLHRREAAAK